MAEKRRYPIGLQTFEDVVNQNCVYVDKTEYVYKMASSPEIECYTLGFPNHEVKTGFAECLHRSNTHSSKVG